MGFKKVIVLFLIFTCARTLWAQQDFAIIQAIVNSSADELNPVFSADGNWFFITRAYHAQNVGGLKDAGDIWFTRKENGQWQSLQHASLLNDDGYNTVAGLQADGSLLVLNRIGENQTKAKTQGISVAKWNGTTWIYSENVSTPYFRSLQPVINGRLSADGNFIVYAADSYGTIGVEDIYLLRKTYNGWSEPIHLGNTVNTNLQELSPSLSKTNDTLFFATTKRNSNTSFDIVYAVRKDDTFLNWTKPELLNPINANYRELFFNSMGNGYAYYTSTFSSEGYGDVKFFISNLSKDTTKQILPIRATPILVGILLNSKTNNFIDGTIEITSDTFNKKLKSENGNFSIALENKKTYSVSAEAKGYISFFEKLTVDFKENNSFTYTIKLKPIEVGATVQLKNVLFKQSSTDLLEESTEELNQVVTFMRENPSVKILLSGHTDNRGVAADNQKLSQMRADKVKQYLVSKGIPGKRIKEKGFGGSKPLYPNDTEENRKMNRRVEFTITKS
ncbi:MAG: OmpA family protein [Cyclobacteriaceae bacterium]|jgi:outer membrane protein OmpA-like peptidoglycan-associated protein|nr:OmpA family protein [Cyclobacteriaceae bacterium]